jgi:C4-dicarboxylate transporter DctQ subunit
MNKKKRSINLNWCILLLQKILNSIDILTEALVIVGVVVITLTVFLAVLSRYVFVSPIVWTIEIARFFFVWIVLLGVSITERYEAHFRVTTFVDTLSQSVRIFVNLLADLVVIITLIILFFISLPYVEQGSRGISPVLQMPLNYLFISLPIGVVLALLSRLRKVGHYIYEIRNSGMSQTKHTPTPNIEQIKYLNRLEEE